MTITYPSSYPVVSDADLLLPAADAYPLQTAMLLANAAYQLHRPSPAPVVWTVGAAANRSWKFRLPILPSSDALSYTLRHVVRCGAGVTAVTVKVEWQSAGGGWTTIYGPTSTGSLTASAANTIDTSATIPAAADELRITYSPTGAAGTILPDSCCPIPAGGSPSARTSAGFWPFDDGLLGASGAPINTELVNRPTRNAVAIVTDRAQALLTYAQETTPLYDGTTIDHVPDDGWALVASGVAQIPYAIGDQTIVARVLADCSGTPASVADRVRVQVGDQWALIDASGNIEEVTLTLSPVGDELDVRVPIEVWMRVGPDVAGGDATYLLAATVARVATYPIALTLINTPDAPADIATLHLATRGVEMHLLRPWAQPALAFDGDSASTGSTVRQWWLPMPPAIRRGRGCIVRCAQNDGAPQSNTEIATTTTSGVPPSPSTKEVVVPTASLGTASYYGQNSEGACVPIYTWSSASYDDSSPSAATDRLLVLPEGLTTPLEQFEVENACGFACHISQVRAPLDWQSI